MAITSNKKLSASDIEYINKAQAYQTGQAYTPSNTVSTDYWSSAGGGGKNTLYGNAGEKSYASNDYLEKAIDSYKKALKRKKDSYKINGMPNI